MPDLVARDGDEIEETVATVGGDSAVAMSLFLPAPRMRRHRVSACRAPFFVLFATILTPLISIVYRREKENDEGGRRYYCRAVHAGGAAA